MCRVSPIAPLFDHAISPGMPILPFPTPVHKGTLGKLGNRALDPLCSLLCSFALMAGSYPRLNPCLLIGRPRPLSRSPRHSGRLVLRLTDPPG
jgi:hypothetical protein